MHLSERMHACVSGMTDALSVERWRHWVIKNDGWKRHTALSSPSLFAHLTDCHSSEPNTHRCRGLDFMLLLSPRQGHIAVAPLPIISVCSDNSSIHNFTQISFLRHLSPKNTHTQTCAWNTCIHRGARLWGINCLSCQSLLWQTA